MLSRSIVYAIVLISCVVTSWTVYATRSDASNAKTGVLRICIDGADSATLGEAVEDLSSIVGRLKSSHDRYSQQLRQAGESDRTAAFQKPVVAAGCPHGYQRLPADKNLPVRPVVHEASDYAIKVFVANSEDMTSFGGSRFLVLPYEMACSSPHVCGEVSAALYVSPDLLSDPDGLFTALEFATGLNVSRYPSSEGPRQK